jgi:hypothetical protein
VAAESVLIDSDHWRHYFLVLGVLWGLMAASRAHAASGLARSRPRAAPGSGGTPHSALWPHKPRRSDGARPSGQGQFWTAAAAAGGACRPRDRDAKQSPYQSFAYLLRIAASRPTRPNKTPTQYKV